MFSYEERVKAINLLIQYDMCYKDVMRELGYPSDKALRNWYAEYEKNGNLHPDCKPRYKYTLEQRQLAVTYYLEHGKSVSRTVRKLGYPSRPQLSKWIAEIAPDQKKHCCLGKAVVNYTQEQK